MARTPFGAGISRAVTTLRAHRHVLGGCAALVHVVSTSCVRLTFADSIFILVRRRRRLTTPYGCSTRLVGGPDDRTTPNAMSPMHPLMSIRPKKGLGLINVAIERGFARRKEMDHDWEDY